MRAQPESTITHLYLKPLNRNFECAKKWAQFFLKPLTARLLIYNKIGIVLDDLQCSHSVFVTE